MAQPKAPFGAGAAKGPHPATVAQPKAPFGAGAAKRPHPATVAPAGAVQRKWVAFKDGPRHAIIRWEQQDEDDQAGYALEDGWYRATLDQRTYWAIKLDDDEADDIATGRYVVRVRPWIVTMVYKEGVTRTAADIDLKIVFGRVREIWKQAGVGIHVARPVAARIDLQKNLNQYASSDAFLGELYDDLRDDINAAILEDRRQERECVQLVFIPTFDRWGLTRHQGNDGFVGPVVFVATHTAGVSTKDDFLEREIPPSQKYVHMGISLDTAHEIGHVLGLEHDKGPALVHRLMHESLYFNIWGQTFKTELEARQIAKDRYPTLGDMTLFTTKNQTTNRSYWTVLHGRDLSGAQIATVLGNDTFRRIAR
ncbi:hypothetical protein WMF28_01740 [Sorangium sp. So ce590]|uniref:hypothetical protein n=1 Tax=Sorangium sp. So ce590 TaxID=3133317 RepID=UPI003F61AC43